MPIQKYKHIRSLLVSNPGEIFDVIASLLTTLNYRYIRRCIGKNTIIRQQTVIRNYANVRIGEGSILQDFIYIRAGVDGYVSLGKRCMVNSFSRFFGHGGIEVGDDTQIGPGVTITTTEHDYRQPELSEVFTKVTIGKHVWVGANTTILPGVTIGDGSVIGAGSVVTKNVPPNSVAVGVPARVIKELQSMNGAEPVPTGEEAVEPSYG